MKYSVLLILFIISLHLVALGQDGQKVLDFNTYMQRVQEHHPMAKAATLSPDKGKAYLLNARGAFDPKAYGNLRQKMYDGLRYYHLPEVGLRIPTWFGMELESGYSRYSGQYLNPENKQPENGLGFLGISIPIGQGLFIDERRTELKMAQNYLELTREEQRRMLNDLLYMAGQAYWSWFELHHSALIYKKARELAELRFDFVRQSVYLGDRSPFDTLEARIQVQNRELVWRKAEMERMKAALKLSLYLWHDGLIPLELDSLTSPVSMEVANLMPLSTRNVSSDSLLANHPELNMRRINIAKQGIERRWKREQIKPSINLKYNALSRTNYEYSMSHPDWNNYQFAVQVSTPLFLRKQRGELKLADLKIQESMLKLESQKLSVKREVETAFIARDYNLEQVLLSEENVRDLAALVQGERRLFQSGESSLFMINSREVMFISASIQLLQNMAELRNSDLQWAYAGGILTDMYTSIP